MFVIDIASADRTACAGGKTFSNSQGKSLAALTCNMAYAGDKAVIGHSALAASKDE